MLIPLAKGLALHLIRVEQLVGANISKSICLHLAAVKAVATCIHVPCWSKIIDVQKNTPTDHSFCRATGQLASDILHKSLPGLRPARKRSKMTKYLPWQID